MIRLSIAIPWILSLVCFLFFPEILLAEKYNIAMITWRGETIAEKGFIDELDHSGYDILLTKFHADQDDARLHKIIIKIQSNSVDLIYVFGTTATKVVLAKIKEIPVVFNIVTRPVDSGIIASWESSKNNATGASNKVSVIHQLKTLKKVVDYKTLGIIYNPKEQNSIIQRNNVKRLEQRFGFSLKDFKISGESDILQTLSQLNTRVDAVFIPADSMIKSLGKKIITMVNSYKIPSFSAVESMVPEDDVLLGFVPKYYELGRMAGKKAILILDGQKPRDIPSSVLDYYNISVNMQTARKINIQIPMSILVMANQIIR